MKQLVKITSILALVLAISACADKNEPNYQFMPNMYEPVGYETYEGVDNGLFPEGTAALQPAENTISRGWMPYGFENTPEGRELAREQQSPLDSLAMEDNLAKGAELYAIYCAVCHGNKGDGQGTLVKREKILGVPSYADAGRDITVGSSYYVMYYGLNSMGSYASQFANEEEMWQVAEYVMKLKQDLTK
ncbi:c-type cytochrome [Allomuricauda sp. SCSIO 65647]|uniref:c-type cytochrome n=1 Tax=Allomuricauda sp. SCSIO 65647 TaxID=2908843 RepID=UPI001F3F6B03|nr:cytochrome c [Muricauda sp. SCSIO 65647]UJH68370.1 cytochrome c [Muricauda sp. SCSIO 65647]